MKILSIRRGFASDHSSTSYEFLAMDKPLSKKERSDVSRLSSRANPTARRVNFTYNVDGYDIPGGWEKLMAKYYDVMYREEYSWWTLVVAFDGNDDMYNKVRAYEFDGCDDLGVRVERSEQRIIIEIHCVVEPEQHWNNDYYDDDSDYESEDTEGNNTTIATGDYILDTLVQVRQQIILGNYGALYAVWEVYGLNDDSPIPPKPTAIASDAKTINDFKDMLSTI